MKEKQFIMFPAELMTDARYKGVTAAAKLLYALMLDRTSLSRKNGWYDREVTIYIYFTLAEAQRVIGCGHDKAVKLVAELDDRRGVGLICRKKQGLGKPKHRVWICSGLGSGRAAVRTAEKRFPALSLWCCPLYSSVGPIPYGISLMSRMREQLLRRFPCTDNLLARI